MLRKTAVITWRGMLTKIMTCIYEETEGWEMNAMMLDGCLYLEENKSPLKKKARQEGQQLVQTYFGYEIFSYKSESCNKTCMIRYSFESYCASDNPASSAAPHDSWGGDVNTNVQWASVIRTSVEDVSIILGGEVDCVKEGAGLNSGLTTSDFVELKTNLVIENPRDEVRFER